MRKIINNTLLHSVVILLVFSFVFSSLLSVRASVSALSWTPHLSAPESGAWTSVAWSPELGIFVAVDASNANSVMTSSDGANWITHASVVAAAHTWISVIWAATAPNGLGGQGLFVAVSYYGAKRVMTSPDGINWTLQTSFGDTTYWDGTGWFSVTWSPTADNGIGGQGLFVAVAIFSAPSDARVMTSPDGINWTLHPSVNDVNAWRSVVWAPTAPNGLGGQGLFVAVAQGGSDQVMTSPDGITWTPHPSAVDGNFWFAVTWSSELNLFVSIAYSGTNQVMTSLDGINWTPHASAVEGNGWTAIAWSPELGLFVAVAQDGGANRIMTSPDGANWTPEASTNDGNTWHGITWSPTRGIFVAVAAAGSNEVMTSNVVAPIISLVSSTPTATGATVMWTTDEESSSQVNYGDTDSYGSSTTLDPTAVFDHSVVLSGFSCNTPHHYQVSSTYVGHNTLSGDQTFTTLPCVPVVTTSDASPIAETAATLNGTIVSTGGENPATRGFHWGSTDSYGTTTAESGSFPAESFSADLTGLTCATTYHYQSYATNSAGTATSSPDATFTTSTCPITSHGIAHLPGPVPPPVLPPIISQTIPPATPPVIPPTLPPVVRPVTTPVAPTVTPPITPPIVPAITLPATPPIASPVPPPVEVTNVQSVSNVPSIPNGVAVSGSGGFSGLGNSACAPSTATDTIGIILGGAEDSYCQTKYLVSQTASEVKNIITTGSGGVIATTAAVTGVVAGSVTMVTSALFLNPVSFSEIFLIPTRLWSLLMTALGLKKRRRPWGTVYDSVTKQPLDPAYVTLKDSEGKEVTSNITDLDGRFGFVVPHPGEYTIFVHKTNHVFPSQKLVGHDHDELYRDLYFGEHFHVSEAGAVVIKNIPMDSEKFDWNEFTKQDQGLMRFYSKRDKWLRRAADIFFGFGFVVAGVAVLAAPKNYNIIIFLLYVLLYFIRTHGAHSRPYGGIFEKGTGIPVSFGIIRISNSATDVEVMHRIADARGRYYALLPNGEYKVRIDRKLSDGSYQTVVSGVPVTVSKGYLSKVFSV